MPIILRVCVAIESDLPLSATPMAPSSKAAAVTDATTTVSTTTTSSGKLAASPSISAAHSTVKAAALSSTGSKMSKKACHSRQPTSLSQLFEESKQTIRSVAARADTPTQGGDKMCTAATAHDSRPLAAIVTASSRSGDHLNSPRPQQSAPDISASRSSRSPGLQHMAAPPLKRHRSLLWLSIQVMLTTTVKVILQQVQDTVEKRMCARVCADNYHDRNHEISGVDSVHCSLNPRTLMSDRSSDTGDGKGYNGGLIVGATSAAQPPALRTATLTDRWRDEGLCLCLQDKDGVYHWVGGTHHFHEVTVLRAPFIAEACLRSHAVFEEERRRRCRQARQQLSSSMRSSSLSSSALASDSSLLSRFNRNAEDTRPVRKSRECSNGRSDRRAEKRGARPAGVSESTTAPSTTATVAYKHDAADMLAGQAFAQKASGLRFAFLKGVVVPMVVLRQYNPHHVMVSKHHPHDQTPWQYAEVRVPADMQVEPLDGSSFSSVATEFCGTAQASVKEAAVDAFTHAEPLAPRVAVVPNSDRPGNTALQSPPSSNSTKTPAKRDFEGEVRSLTTAWMPASSSVLSVSSAWTLASRSSLPNESCEATADADGPSAHAMVFDTQQCRSNHSMEAAAANTAAAAGPVGLVMPTTTVERASEVNNPCAMTGALRARGIIHRQARATLAAEEDAACTALATAQRDYAAALAEYKAAVLYSRAEPTAVDECGVQVSQPTPFPDAELTFLLQRKMEVQRRLEVYWQAEQQCERLTTLTECLEKELREQEERRELLTQPLRHRNDSAAFATGC